MSDALLELLKGQNTREAPWNVMINCEVAIRQGETSWALECLHEIARVMVSSPGSSSKVPVQERLANDRSVHELKRPRPEHPLDETRQNKQPWRPVKQEHFSQSEQYDNETWEANDESNEPEPQDDDETREANDESDEPEPLDELPTVHRAVLEADDPDLDTDTVKLLELVAEILHKRMKRKEDSPDSEDAAPCTYLELMEALQGAKNRLPEAIAKQKIFGRPINASRARKSSDSFLTSGV
ncbi:MAG: hypothetical protein MHM6MM_007719 [Cercozoa sp. M6MM]